MSSFKQTVYFKASSLADKHYIFMFFVVQVELSSKSENIWKCLKRFCEYAGLSGFGTSLHHVELNEGSPGCPLGTPKSSFFRVPGRFFQGLDN